MRAARAALLVLAVSSMSATAAAAPGGQPRDFASSSRENKPHYHDGFFFMGALGPSWFEASSSWSDDDGDGSRRFYGPGAGLELALGGSFGGGVNFGGVFARETVLSLSGTDENDEALDLEGTRFAVTRLGILFDVYFRAQGGAHVLGEGGLYELDVTRASGDFDDDPSGLFVALGAGYDWWVSPQAAVGALLRLSYAPLDVSEGAQDAAVTVFSPALSLSMTYQ